MRWFFGSLLFCLLPAAAFPANTIEFRVDMGGPTACGLFAPDDGDGVIVRGDFNGWAGEDFVLEDGDHDGIFRATFAVAGDSGSVCDFKYLIRKASGKVLWEKKPNPENEPHGCRQIRLAGGRRSLELAVFDFDRYYLAAIGQEVVFTAEELRADFKTFRQTLENEHCCLYEFTDKAEFDRLFDQQFQLIDRTMPPHDFFRILTPITARIGCGHTAVWMPGGYWDIDREGLFPLRIILIENRVVVAGCYTDSVQVARGSIVQEINGRPVAAIIEEMRANYSADAMNPHFIEAQIERRFPLLYARRFGFPEHFVVKILPPQGRDGETRTLTPATDQAVRAVVFSHFRHPPLGFEVRAAENVAVLTVPTFIYYDRVPYFTGFIDSCFTAIRDGNIGNLILDLRGNDGGDPFCAAPLFSYLQPVPLPYFAEPYGKYSELAEPLPLPENRFRGRLITLMDGRCFSTNAHFCALLDYHGIGRFVGTESGATYICNAGQNTIKNLENTGIQLYFGRSPYAAAVEGMDRSRPIMPDYRIVETYQGFLDGGDDCMTKALQLVGQSAE